MTPTERESILKDLASSRDRVLDIVQGLSPAQANFRPRAERWSVAENVEHVIVVEQRVLAGVQRILNDPAHTPLAGAFEGQDAKIVGMIAVVDKPLAAPDPVRPTGRWQGTELLREFEQTRKTTGDFVASTQADVKARCFPHPFFGPMSCYQWLLAISAHTNRHYAQIQQVKSASGFPTA
ncbi:MAG TPA: DinB family protein [Candidatus Acidoferrum sp.]|jgi:hypothetical protein